MSKKIFLFVAIIAVSIAWLGGVFSIRLSPFSFSIQRPEKDFLKKVARKIESFVYREATIHNPPGDVMPDQIDNRLKQEIKERIN